MDVITDWRLRDDGQVFKMRLVANALAMGRRRSTNNLVAIVDKSSLETGDKQMKRIGILLGFVIVSVVVRCVISNSREW